MTQNLISLRIKLKKLGYDNKSNGMRVLNSITCAVRVEWDVRFVKPLNFKEEEKLVNKVQYKSSSTSSLPKLPKIPTLPITLAISLLI